MLLLKQMSLILIIWAIGEYLSMILSPIQFIPGNILGMLILLIGLMTGIIKERHVADVGQFLIQHMPLFFIPLAINLLNQTINLTWGYLFLITLITTPIMMVTSTFVTDKMMKFKEKN